MARFPIIQRPCPHPGDLDDIITDGRCRLCDRHVHDLTDMSDGERHAIVAAHRGDLCVRYTVLRPALAAMAMGVASTTAVAAERPPVAHHREQKAAKAAHAKAAPPVVPVTLAGAPAVPASDDATAQEPSVQWTQETAAPPQD